MALLPWLSQFTEPQFLCSESLPCGRLKGWLLLSTPALALLQFLGLRTAPPEFGEPMSLDNS